MWSHTAVLPPKSSFALSIGGEWKHDAEICKLTGLFLLNGLKNIVPGLKVGLYREDGIVAINKKNNQCKKRISYMVLLRQ